MQKESTISLSYLAQEIVVQRHLAFGINVLQIPSEAFALQTIAKRPSFTDIASHRLSST